MKKIIIALALAACSSVTIAATSELAVCTATTPVNVPGTQDGTLFVRTTFAPTCSVNSIVVVNDDAIKVWATGASIKGQSIFGGSTNGGTVGNMGPCNAGKACGTAADTTTAVKTKTAAAALLGST